MLSAGGDPLFLRPDGGDRPAVLLFRLAGGWCSTWKLCVQLSHEHVDMAQRQGVPHLAAGRGSAYSWNYWTTFDDLDV